MGEVDLVGALANSIKRFKDDKNDLAGRVHGIQVSALSKGKPESFALLTLNLASRSCAPASTRSIRFGQARGTR